MASPQLPAPSTALHLDSTFGAGLVGAFLAFGLYGAACIQAVHYYTTYGKDPILLKTMVAVLWILESVQAAFTTHAMYFYLVSNFADPLSLLNIVWSIPVQLPIAAVISLIVNSFFVARIWRFGRSMISLTILLPLLVARFALSIYYTVRTFQDLSFLALSKVFVPGIASLAVIAASDVSIAISLCIVLHKRRTGIPNTDMILNRLITWTAQTAIFPAVLAIADAIALAAGRSTFVFLCFFFLLCRVYTNTGLSALNSRRSLQSKAVSGDSIPLSSRTQGVPWSSGQQFTKNSNPGRDDQLRDGEDVVSISPGPMPVYISKYDAGQSAPEKWAK